MGYYYLASQLPYLVYGQTPPMTSEAFRELAKSLLGARDAALFDLVNLDPSPPEPGEDGFAYAKSAKPCGSDFIDNWREWERVLRLNLAKHRAHKTGREGPPVEIPSEPLDAAATAAKAASGTENPLDGEMLLDKARWSAIEEMQGVDIFDRKVIYAYLLKLMLLERRASFQAEKGFLEYKSLYASITDSNSPAGETK